MKKLSVLAAVAVILSAGCERIDHSGEKYYSVTDPVQLDTVARLLAALPIEKEQIAEVHDAVSSSSGNGYDEEYTMRDLLVSPGAGVGEDESVKSMKTRTYSRPLKDLIAEHLMRTKASGAGDTGMSAEEYLDALENSDVQIYWPYSEQWDGEKMPVITFDPGNGAEANTGYRLVQDSEGNRSVEEIVVDEEMAVAVPVWVVNRNDDSGYSTVELLRKQDPEWGTGGGSIVVKPSGTEMETKSNTQVKTLILKDFKMRRNYDCWFAGASEFFVKCGAVEDFTASTEAEMKLYSPQITDFMIVVKRSQVDEVIPMNVVLVSQWSEQLNNVAFMVTEDDGGTRTEWKCSATVKVKSKSYGFDISLPFNTKDDIVWRGQLASGYLEKYDGIASRLGDTEITFQYAE